MMKVRDLCLSVLLPLCFFGATSCDKEIVSEESTLSGAGVENVAANSSLRVKSRAPLSAEGVVSFPLHVYVFLGEQCRAVQTLASASDQMELQLPAAAYDVYAVGGATALSYTLPTEAEALPSSPLALQQGSDHADLMASQNTVQLREGQQTELTLTMERKVLQLRSVKLKNLPADVSSVSVGFAPLYQYVTLSGEYGGRDALDNVVLTTTEDDEDGTWTMSDALYLLPSIGNATISISITSTSGTKNYSYTCTEPLVANKIFDIEGTYEDANGILLAGTITGATWEGERKITFSFNGAGDTETIDDEPVNVEPDDEPIYDPNDNTVSAIPAVGDMFHGCCVIAVNNVTATTADLVLLSPTEENGVATSDDDPEPGKDTSVSENKINAELLNWKASGYTEWRLLTINEIGSKIKNNYSKINASLASSGQTLLSNNFYLVWHSSGCVWSVNCKTGDSKYTFDSSAILRPVTDVTVVLSQ